MTCWSLGWCVCTNRPGVVEFEVGADGRRTGRWRRWQFVRALRRGVPLPSLRETEPWR